MRTLKLFTAVVVMVGGALSCSCGSTRLVTAGNVAPSWVRTAMGGDCDVAASIDLGAFESHKKKDKDPEGSSILGLGRTALSAASPIPVANSKRLAGCIRLMPGTGIIESWVVIVQGLPRADVLPLPKDASLTIADREGIARVFLFSDSSTIVVGSKSIAHKVQSLKNDDVAGEIDLPSNVYAQVAIGGAPTQRISSEWHSDRKYGQWVRGLDALEMRLDNDGSHLRLVMHARYATAEDAERVEGLMRTYWAYLHSSEADHEETARLLSLVRGMLNQEIRRDRGSPDIDATYTLVPPREKKSPPAVVRASGAAPTSDYASPCPPKQRFDLEARKCVEAQ